jgi:hypothetical protein
LDEYWQKVIAIDKVTEFSKHLCSQPLKEFLEVENAIKGGEKGSTVLQKTLFILLYSLS